MSGPSERIRSMKNKLSLLSKSSGKCFHHYYASLEYRCVYRLPTVNPHQLTRLIPYLIAPLILLVGAGIAAALLGTVFNHPSSTTSEQSSLVVVRWYSWVSFPLLDAETIVTTTTTTTSKFLLGGQIKY